MESDNGTLAEYLTGLWNNPTGQLARHLALREAHTVFLTDNAPSTESWAIGRIKKALVTSEVYTAQPVLLDAGCGPGVYLQGLTGAGRQLVGLDRNRAALEEARQRLGRSAGVELVQGDVLHLPFAPANFSAAMCNRMLNQTGDIARALAEVATALVAGGLLFIVTADSEDSSWLRATHEANLHKLGFPAYLYTHSTRPDQRLNRQNGPEWLAPQFDITEVALYERRLEFDRSADLLEHYATGLFFHKVRQLDEPGLVAGQWVALYREMQQQIETELTKTGRLTLSDGATLFQATRK